MGEHPLSAPRFVRRTTLRAGEYRKNFRQIDGDVISAVTSPEADRVTPLMSKIYLRLAHAPAPYWERDGVLRFAGEARAARPLTAWAALCAVAGVSSATANKALRWLHERGIVGYYAGKNGAGIRVFLNRAASSIGTRGGQKILEFPRASSGEGGTSAGEAASNDSSAVLEVSDEGCSPRAPQGGAERAAAVNTTPGPHPSHPGHPPQGVSPGHLSPPRTPPRAEVAVAEIVSRLSRELGPSLQAAARLAAAHEHERTREWLESRGLPKAARVAQRETYNLLRKYGAVSEAGHASHANVGRDGYTPQDPHRLGEEEVTELAQACVAMLAVQGQSIEVTLSGMSSAVGGFLLPEDAPRVRQKAQYLLGGPSPVAERGGLDG